MPAPFRETSPYSIEPQGAFWAIRHDHFGIVLDEIESYGSAECHLEELEAQNADKARAEADEAAADSLAEATRSFLSALDRGDFGDLRIGTPDDRAESAYVADLRLKLAAFERAALTSEAA